MASAEMTCSEFAAAERNADRPPLKGSDVYRSRLGAQKQPLAITAMSETRAWRELTTQAAAAQERP